MVVVEQLTFLLFLKMADEQAKAPYLIEAQRRDAAATLADFLRADLSARPKARSCPRTPKGKGPRSKAGEMRRLDFIKRGAFDGNTSAEWQLRPTLLYLLSEGSGFGRTVRLVVRPKPAASQRSGKVLSRAFSPPSCGAT